MLMGHLPGPRFNVWRRPSSWTASADLNLGSLPKLEPEIKCFLQEPATTQEEGEGSDPLQEPMAKECKKWIVCRGHQVHTPDWWWELVGILGTNNFQELTQKIMASFEVSWVKGKAKDVKNDYLVPSDPNASARRNSCHLKTQCTPARTLKRDILKRPWPTNGEG